MIQLALTAALWLLYQAVPYPGGFGNERTLEEVLCAHGPPLLSARLAKIEAPRWVLWGRFLPVPAWRLVASDLQLVHAEDSPHLTGRVLIYCEGNVLNRWARLELFAMAVGERMRRATPFIGREGPGQKLLRAGPGSEDLCRHVTPIDPIRLTLVYINPRGMVLRTVGTRIRELDLSDP